MLETRASKGVFAVTAVFYVVMLLLLIQAAWG